jgi:outer membrane biogenesis lipoprotein LolB
VERQDLFLLLLLRLLVLRLLRLVQLLLCLVHCALMPHRQQGRLQEPHLWQQQQQEVQRLQ